MYLFNLKINAYHSILLILVLCSKIAEVLSVEATTDIPIEEESTTEPDLSTVLPTTNDVEEISSVEEKSHNVLNDDNNKEKGFLAVPIQAKKGLSKLIMGDNKLKPLLQTKVEE